MENIAKPVSPVLQKIQIYETNFSITFGILKNEMATRYETDKSHSIHCNTVECRIIHNPTGLTYDHQFTKYQLDHIANIHGSLDNFCEFVKKCCEHDDETFSNNATVDFDENDPTILWAVFDGYNAFNSQKIQTEQYKFDLIIYEEKEMIRDLIQLAFSLNNDCMDLYTENEKLKKRVFLLQNKLFTQIVQEHTFSVNSRGQQYSPISSPTSSQTFSPISSPTTPTNKTNYCYK